MDAINNITVFDIPLLTLIIWGLAGAVAGTLLMGRRPIGLLGDLVIGVLGGLLGGWGRVKVPNWIADVVEGSNPGLAQSIRDFRFARHIGGVSPALAERIGDFLVALIGAIVVLLLLRMLIRRK